MKKKMMAVLLAGIMVLSAGCGKEGKVTVGEYKGLALTNVSQETVDKEIQAMLESYAELVEVDRAAVEGDTVNINYVGLKDGVAFEGGTMDAEEGTDLELGSGSYIEGFEEGLIGAVAGEKRDLNLTFPEDYGKEELNGQAVVFQVTVNAVKESVVPELTDAFLAEKYPDYPTVAQFTEALRDEMNMNSYYEQVTEQVMASSEVKKYNEANVLLRKQQLITERLEYAEQAAAYYGLDTAMALLYFVGYESEEALEEAMGEYAYEVEKNAMIIAEIAKLENIEVEDSYYNEQAAGMAEYYGYTDIASFEKAYGKDTIKDAMISELVMQFIIENAVITDAQ